MPRPATVSSEQLTDALMRLVVDGGLEAVSVRTVAKEAGVSVGAVQYHFKTKDDLLYAAYERVIDQVALRAQAIVATSPLDFAGKLLQELLPLDERRTGELKIAMAFSARAIYSERLAALYTHGYGALGDAISGAFEQANPALDCRQEAIQAIAMTDGLAWEMLCAPTRLSAAQAVDALEAHLARLVP
jgi:TetR/AcrR family transcriptional repressor of bet genes